MYCVHDFELLGGGWGCGGGRGRWWEGMGLWWWEGSGSCPQAPVLITPESV